MGSPGTVHPEWGRYVAAVAAELGSVAGLVGTLTSTIPAGAGLSSSAALEVATALALLAASAAPEGEGDRSSLPPGSLAGSAGDPTDLDVAQRAELALLCQRAEHRAVGVPSGIMDQLSICRGTAGAATLIDCATLEVTHVPIPDSAAVWVLHSGEARRLAGSAYADRRARAEEAAELLGPLPSADHTEVEALGDPLLRRRARHVRSECDRAVEFAEALGRGDMPDAGRLMLASHRSLASDYEVSNQGARRPRGRARRRPGCVRRTTHRCRLRWLRRGAVRSGSGPGRVTVGIAWRVAGGPQRGDLGAAALASARAN
ncbi:MAG: hypothetical protein M5U19_12625 [Microthrixaceae bacterium]|nr:hypothetical protein [Microthrixaceae bacterium]